MQELLYQEIPTSDQQAVISWLHQMRLPSSLGTQVPTASGFRMRHQESEWVIFTWSLQNTTYLKAVQWSGQPLPAQTDWLRQLPLLLQKQFPLHYPALPEVDLESQSIFTALEPHYPQTVKFFQVIPNGEFDLQRVYWWEKRWREEVRKTRELQPQPVIRSGPRSAEVAVGDLPLWDLVVIGGALGVIQAAIMAQMGYRVVLVERLPFGRMNREWNISRRELETLVEMGLLTPTEVESLILREYVDGYNKFFDGNSPVKAPVLHTPTVLNLALNAERLLHLCGQKLQAAGGKILDRTEFEQADLEAEQILLQVKDLSSGQTQHLRARLLIDAMGTASPIAQADRLQAYDSVCPTVGAVIQSGFEPGVWSADVGDILASHGDISRGRQLIWELFPGEHQELTFYLFHYHQVHPDNPGSLLEMYEDFFTILPEYRRCRMENLQWKKATFGYIPGRFERSARQSSSLHDRVLAIGDAAALQSPLSFTGFGSLIRNAPRLTDLLDTALRHDLLTSQDLRRIRAYQGNASVTWLFSRGMMVPTGRSLPPERINAVLNSFFGILAAEPPEVADDFIKDRAEWWDFTRMALKAARQNPRLLVWIWQAVGWHGFLQWWPTYMAYTFSAWSAYLLRGWVPVLLRSWQPRLESWSPRLWHRLLAWSYTLTYGHGHPQLEFRLKPPENHRDATASGMDPSPHSPL